MSLQWMCNKSPRDGRKWMCNKSPRDGRKWM